MNKIKKIIITTLCLITVLSVFTSLTSCTVLSGDTAYDLAVENGFEGSLEEWLESLEGKDGKDGENGEKGENGKDSQTSGTVGDSNVITVEGTPDIKYAAAKGLLSSVSVRCSSSSAGSWFPGSQGSSYSSAGSGVIYKLDKSIGNALIITNYHVVYSSSARNNNYICDTIDVFLYGSETEDMAISAAYVGGSKYYDIAVLYVEDSDILKNSAAEAVTIANSDALHAGQTAIAIGNPENGGISVSKGIVSKESEYITMNSVDGSASISLRVVRVDTAVNSGNSGGGLFDGEGNLIGIVNAKSVESGVENIGYAIPSNVARAIADNIIHYCADGSNHSVMRTIVGVTVRVSSSKAQYDVETGLVDIFETISVVEVTPGSLSDGVLRADDTLVSLTLDSKTTQITRQYHLIDAMLDARVGSVASFEIIRDGERMTVQVEITKDCLTEY